MSRAGNYDYSQQKSVVDIARRVSRNFQSQPFRHLVFHHLRTSMIRRLRQQVLSPMEVLQAPILTPLTMIVVRDIKVSASLERKDDLGAVSLVTG